MWMFSDYERGFIEGLLDSDGSITLKRQGNNYSGYSPIVRVSVSNNPKEFLEKVRRILSCGHKLTLKKGDKCSNFALGQTDSKELLEQIKLVVKKGRRKVALKLIQFKEQYFKDIRFNLPNWYKQEIDNLIEQFYTA